MFHKPILILCFAFIFGIFFQEQGYSSINISIFFIILGGALSFFYLRKIKTIGFFLLFFGIGSFCHLINENFPPKIHLNKTENITFILDKKLNSNEKNKRYEILILNKNIKAVVSIPKDFPELNFTQFYNADAFINPIEKPKHSYQFDYQKYMSRKNIFYQAYIPNEIKSTNRPSLSILEKIKQYRLLVLQKIDKSSVLNTYNKAFLKGIILADRTEIDPKTIQDFTKTGLIHILAISGAHIAIIFLTMEFLFSRFLPKKWSILICITTIWAFVIFIGFGNSVVRAAIMLSIHHIYILLQRRSNLFHTLSLSALILLIINTHEIFDVGFQLSFSAVFGIFWLHQLILSLFPQKTNKIYNYFITLFSTTISAQIITLPFIIYYFNQFPLISIITNLVILWFAQVMIIFSFFITLLFGLDLNFSIIENIYNQICTIFLEIIHYFSQFDDFLIQNIPMNIWECISLFFIILFLRFLTLNPTFKNLSKISFLVILFLSIRTISDWKAYQKEEVLTHHFYKNTILSIKNKNKIVFYVPKEADREKVIKYIITPYTNHCRTYNFEIQPLPENYKNLKNK